MKPYPVKLGSEMVLVKICGLTNIEDALAAAELGADVLGFVFAPSPRRIEPDQAAEIISQLHPPILTAGVFVNESPFRVQVIRDLCRLDIVQLHGDENEEAAAFVNGRVIKAIRMDGRFRPWAAIYPKALLLLETHRPGRAGGTGQTFDWRLAIEPARQRPIILAGGLTPENVKSAVEMVQPYGVDVSSGVEKEMGRKDHVKLRDFIRRAKRGLGRE